MNTIRLDLIESTTRVLTLDIDADDLEHAQRLAVSRHYKSDPRVRIVQDLVIDRDGDILSPSEWTVEEILQREG